MSWNAKIVRVVVGIIIQHGKVLIAKRPADKSYAGFWEFPGGKVESSETNLIALKRELKEELNIEILNAENWFTLPYQYKDINVLLDNWLIKNFIGEVKAMEMQEIKWILPLEFEQYNFLAANKKIIEAIQFTPQIFYK